MFTTKECAWAQINVTVLGRKIVGLRGFEYKKTIEKEHLYAAGAKPIDIQPGNEKIEGNLKLLKFEVDMMNEAAQAAGFADITELPHTAVVISVTYKKSPTDRMREASVGGVSFTEIPYSMEQGAKMMEMTLPFLAMNLTLL